MDERDGNIERVRRLWRERKVEVGENKIGEGAKGRVGVSVGSLGLTAS